MLGQVKAVIEFLSTARLGLGDGDAFNKARDAQVVHLMNVLPTVDSTIDDASATMKSLQGDAAMATLTDDHRRQLASTIASSMTPTTTPTAPKATARSSCQSHMSMWNYFTQPEWDCLKGVSSMEKKIDVVVTRALSIGLTHPNEPTFASMTALLVVADGNKMSNIEAMDVLSRMKKHLRLRRTVKQQTCMSFPFAVADFVAQYPDMLKGEAWVPPAIHPSNIENRRLVMACRKTHKSVGASSGSARPMSWPALANIDMDTLQGLLAIKVAGARQGDIPLTMCPPRCNDGRSAGRPLAIDTPPMIDANQPSPPTSSASQLPALTNGNSNSQLVADAKDEEKHPKEEHKHAPQEQDDSKTPPTNPTQMTTQTPQSPVNLDTSLEQIANAIDQGKKRKPTDPTLAVPKPKAKSKAAGKAAGKAKAKAKASAKASAKAATRAKERDQETRDLRSLSADAKSRGAKGGHKPHLRVEWSRSQVVAVTGRKGPGSTRTFKFLSKNQVDAASRAARFWLAEQGC